MLYFRVFVRRISTSSVVPFASRIPVPRRSFPKFHGMISFADPHPLTLLESYRFKNIAGKGSLSIPYPAFSISHSPYTLPSSASRKSCICHSYENTGGVGVFFPFWLALNSDEGFNQSSMRKGDSSLILPTDHRSSASVVERRSRPGQDCPLTCPEPVGATALYCFKSFSCNTCESSRKCVDSKRLT